MSQFALGFKGAMAAVMLSAVAITTSLAAGPRPASTAPVSAEPAAVELLLASAAKDFGAAGSHRPSAIRDARVGFVRESGKGNYLLCGCFKTGTGTGATWTAFATIKTADYEQWLGASAQGICGQTNVRWYPGDHAESLMRRLGR